MDGPLQRRWQLPRVLHRLWRPAADVGDLARFRDALPSGSYLAISHGTRDLPVRPDMSEQEMAEMGTRVERLYQQVERLKREEPDEDNYGEDHVVPD